jgi:hypothetical protein
VGFASPIQRLLTIAAIVVGTCTGSFGETAPPGCGSNARLEIVPAQPGAGDPLTVIAAGDWTDSCVPRRLEIAQAGSLLTVRAVHNYPPGTGCLTVITPWRLVLPLGRLAPGTYTAYLYVTNPWEAEPSEPCASLRFVVPVAAPIIFLPLLMSNSFQVH